MITDLHRKRLDSANGEMARRLEKLRKVRTTGDPQSIKIVELAYFQALRLVYDTSVDAAAAVGNHSASSASASAND